MTLDSSRPFRLGANYTPSRGWFHHWLDFDPREQEEDFTAIAAAGLDHVRVFALWPLLQPHRGMVRRSALDDLRTVVRVAGDCGLDVSVDVLQGHLSSFEFLPPWVVTWHERNVFSDEAVVSAQAELVGSVASALATEPNLVGVNLANEPNNLLTAYPATAEETDAWVERLLAAAHGAHPDGRHCHSAFDAVWYEPGHGFAPRTVADRGAMVVSHPWVFSEAVGTTYGALSTEATHLAEYVAEVSRAWSRDPDKPLWVQEVGAPVPSVPERDAPEFAARTLRNLARCANLWGVTWWCSHDVSRTLLDFPELEYSLGLFGNDQRRNMPKPVLSALVSTYSLLRQEAVQPPPRTTALVIDVDRPAEVTRPGGTVFTEWMRRTAAGEAPAVVLSERMEDDAYLEGRGITRIVTRGRDRGPRGGARGRRPPATDAAPPGAGS